MKLSVIIPCYNEKNTILKIVEEVCASTDLEKEIIIVDDCSSDGTREILKSANPSLADKIIYHEKNQGKGAAIRSGIAAADGDILIIQDADLEYNPREYTKLVKPILEGKADVVYGSRFLRDNPHRVLVYWHSVGNRFLTFVSNMFSNLALTDMETCYKVFKREIIQQITIEENRFGFEPEITAKLAKMNCRIYEVGISYFERSYEDGKKIGWRDGIRTIFCILKYNLFS